MFSPTWHTTYCLSYLVVLEWRPDFLSGQDVVGWRQAKSTGQTLHEKVVGQQFAWASNSIVQGDKPALDIINTDNHSEECGVGRAVVQYGQCPRLFGDLTGKPKPTCYTETIWCSKQADDSRGIHFGHGRDYHSNLVTLSTWWCGCI